jgi:hypothetical protein
MTRQTQKAQPLTTRSAQAAQIFSWTAWFLLLTAPLHAKDGIKTEVLGENELVVLEDGFEVRRDALLRRQILKPFPPGDAGDLGATLSALFLQTDDARANKTLLGFVQKGFKHIRGTPRNAFSMGEILWLGPTLTRIALFFDSANSTLRPGLTPQTSDAVHQLLWDWVQHQTQPGRFDMEGLAPEKAWDLTGTENQDAAGICGIWGALKLLSSAPEYRSRVLPDNASVEAHFQAINAFVKEVIRERIRRGLQIETASPGYAQYTLHGFYNYHDFGDPELRKLAASFLTLWWADWAQEQIGGVRGGAKARHYQGKGRLNGLDDSMLGFAGLYLGSLPDGANQLLTCAATSSYRLPLVVMDIALDLKGRGVYETISRRPGLGAQSASSSGEPTPPGGRMRLEPSFGGLLRYTFCTPEFIVGSWMLEKRENNQWAPISSQNRWEGIIYSDGPAARVFPQCTAVNKTQTKALNEHFSVQNKGTLLVARLEPPYSQHAGDLRIYVAPALRRIEEGGIVFLESKGAYTAIRPAPGGYVWEENNWLRPANQKNPVVLEVARAVDYPGGLAEFQAKVRAARYDLSPQTLIYEGLGDSGRFEFDLSMDNLPRINGKPVDLQPDFTYKSPFIFAKWPADHVTIQKGTRSLVLDLNR